MNDSRNPRAATITSAHHLTRIAARVTGEQTSPAAWRALSILRAEGPMRLGELAVASRVAQPALSKLVLNLAGDDYIRRIADVDDARAWLIATTPKGERALGAWQDAHATDATDDETRTPASPPVGDRVSPTAEAAA